jgi:hypothetical protein
MKIHIAILITLAISSGGCGYRVDHDHAIRKNGGYAQLRDECNNVYTAIDQTVTSYLPMTNLPPLLTALKPQKVLVHSTEEPVLNIQTSGGFTHQGLLVVLNTNSTYLPQIGIRHGWIVENIAPGVFEYRE